MSRTLKKYPTTDEIVAALGPEEIDTRAAALGTYDRTQTLSTYDGDVLNPDILRALALQLEGQQREYPNAKMNRQLSVTRERPIEELRQIVIDRESQKRYFNPDQFGCYTEDEIVPR